MTDRWDPSNADHKALGHQIEVGNGIPQMRHISKAVKALKIVGFEVEHEEDLAERPDPIRWYYPLEGNIFKAQTLWDMVLVFGISWLGRSVTHNAIRFLEYGKMLPNGTHNVIQKLKIARAALVETGEKRVRTDVHAV